VPVHLIGKLNKDGPDIVPKGKEPSISFTTDNR
jgi:hypothetical protein